MACPSCDVQVLDMKNPEVAERAKGPGIRFVPAVVIDGKIGIAAQDGAMTRTH